MLREDIEDLKGSIVIMENQIKEQTLALELLQEVKKTSKRWFIAFIITMVALVGTNIAWLIYENQFETIETTEQTIEDIDNVDNTNFTQSIN